jgi:two-component system nitrate/nitrite response regulator NarL
MPVPKVLLCHRIRLFGECLAKALNETSSLHCSAVGSQDVLSQLAQLEAGSVQLLLWDPMISTEHSFVFEDLVRERFPACKVMLLMSESATDQLVELAYHGTQGCISEDALFDELCSAIQIVLSGKPYCSPQLANILFSQLGTLDRHHHWSKSVDEACLTAREREILRLITLEQLGNKQIARRLHVSLYTVKNHVHNIIEKLGVEDRHQAAQVARSRRLLVEAHR